MGQVGQLGINTNQVLPFLQAYLTIRIVVFVGHRPTLLVDKENHFQASVGHRPTLFVIDDNPVGIGRCPIIHRYCF